ncbi:LOW QUALITY PROTEIN: hypothetical protein Cgig2_027392 [Carnegiea gigantea]|uniref:Uncharacterized protein n=1 Tax=Carnegiea gigantea TaxID=171969 RepID=A0A9Q1K3S1_9CARY|nr:LOW QUALITY PROTEIN: hypothetical protein Cgig2_027392 [Carnegiea gigantea]
MKQHKIQFFTTIIETGSENRYKQNRGIGATRQVLCRPRALPSKMSRPQLPRDCFTLRRRRDKLHLVGIATLRSCPLALVHKAQVGLKIPVVQKFACKARPYRGKRGRHSGLADSLAPWPGLHQPRPSLADAAAPSFRFCGPLDLPAASHSMSPSSRRHSATAFTPLAKTSAMAISSSETFGGSEAPGATRSQDLTISWTRESLTLAFALTKLAKGRGVSEEALLATGVKALAPWEGVGCACLAGVRYPNDRLPDW